MAKSSGYDVSEIQRVLDATLAWSERSLGPDARERFKRFGLGKKPQDIIEIDIREVKISDEGWHMSVECESVKWDVCLRQLPSQAANERLRWSIENYAQEDPYNVSRCEESALETKSFSNMLFSDLQLAPKVSHILKSRALSRISILITQTSHHSPYHQLQWELLEDQAVWKPIFSEAPCVSVTRSYHFPTPFSIRAYEEFKLVYVMARPQVKREKFIDHRLLLRSLAGTIDGIDRMAINVRLFIVRPGSWEALVEHLNFIRIKHGKGSVSLIHLDMHGRMRKSTDGGIGYCLDFVHHATGRRNPIPAFKLGKLLQQHGIRNAVINACESANPRVDSANLANVLMQHGLSNVLAMSFKLATTAAEIFFGTFYKSFLETAPNFPKATSDGRAALSRSPLRRANFGLRVAVHDWMVPVLYSNCADESINTIRTRSGHLRHYNGRGDTASPASALAPEAARYEAERLRSPPEVDYDNPYWASGKLNPGFIGRDWEILQIEGKLSGKQNAILHLYGPAGSGKTALADELSTWWARTGFVTRKLRQISCRDSTFINDMRKISAGKMEVQANSGAISNFMDEEPNAFEHSVIFVDDLDLIDEDLEQQDRSEVLGILCEMLPSIASPTTRLVLMSRQKSLVFQTTQSDSYLSILLTNAEKVELKGLSGADAAEFGSYVLTKKGEDMQQLDLDNAKSLERLYEEFAYLPGTIESFLQHCSFRKQGLHPAILSSRRQLGQPLGVRVLILNLETIQEIFESVENDVLFTSILLAPFDLYLPDTTQLALYLMWPMQHEPWLIDMINQMKTHPRMLAAYRSQFGPDAEVDGEGLSTFFKWSMRTMHSWILDFISRCIIRGLMIEDQSGRAGNRIWVHPELTSFMRGIVREKFLPEVQSGINRSFSNYMSTYVQQLAYDGAHVGSQGASVSQKTSSQRRWSIDDVHESIRVESQNYLRAARLGASYVGKKIDGEIVVNYKQYWTMNHEIFEALKSSHTVYQFEQWVQIIIPLIEYCLGSRVEEEEEESGRAELTGEDLTFPFWVIRATWYTTYTRRGANGCKDLNAVIKKILKQSAGRDLPSSVQETLQWMIETVGEQHEDSSKPIESDRDTRFQLLSTDAFDRLIHACQYQSRGSQKITAIFCEIQVLWKDYKASGDVSLEIAPWITTTIEQNDMELSKQNNLGLFALAFGLALDHRNDPEQGGLCFKIEHLMLQGNIQEARKLVNEGLKTAILQDNMYGEYDFRRYMLRVLEYGIEADVSRAILDVVAICERIGRDTSRWCACQRLLLKAREASTTGDEDQATERAFRALRSSVAEYKNLKHQRRINQYVAKTGIVPAIISIYVDLCLSVSDTSHDESMADLAGVVQWCLTVLCHSAAKSSTCRDELLFQMIEPEPFRNLQEIAGRSGLETIKALVHVLVIAEEKRQAIKVDPNLNSATELPIVQHALKDALFGVPPEPSIDENASPNLEIARELALRLSRDPKNTIPTEPYFVINKDGYIGWLDAEIDRILSKRSRDVPSSEDPVEQALSSSMLDQIGIDIEFPESDTKPEIHYGIHAETNELVILMEVGESWYMIDPTSLVPAGHEIDFEEQEEEEEEEEEDDDDGREGNYAQALAQLSPGLQIAPTDMAALSLAERSIQRVNTEELVASNATEMSLRRAFTF